VGNYEIKYVDKKIDDDVQIVAVKSLMPDHLFGETGRFRSKVFETYAELRQVLINYLDDKVVSTMQKPTPMDLSMLSREQLAGLTSDQLYSMAQGFKEPLADTAPQAKGQEEQAEDDMFAMYGYGKGRGKHGKKGEPWGFQKRGVKQKGPRWDCGGDHLRRECPHNAGQEQQGKGKGDGKGKGKGSKGWQQKSWNEWGQSNKWNSKGGRQGMYAMGEEDEPQAEEDMFFLGHLGNEEPLDNGESITCQD
jgi:hypothetical protein